MKVRIKDFEKEANSIRICFALAGLNIEYQTAYYVNEILKRMKEKGDEFSVKDGAELEVANAEKWENYFKALAEKDANP